ncbi:MAG TPA: hypothetical protein VN924_19665 [Bryobacteraceae bacterium]|nr:hypothetical protein [Bryobacteraceae bacterium]
MMRFLRTVFGVGESHRMFQADVLRWKCFAPHPFWEGSRGYALRYKGKIAAFGCVVPCRFLTGSGTVASCNVIDWAASKAVPGAGIMLYRHIQGLTGTMINIGGTEDARQVLPRIGFHAGAEIHHYTRVLRPWRYFRMADRKDWKSPLRLARDYRELRRAARDAGHGLTAWRVDSFDGMATGTFPDPAFTQQVVCARTPESLNYFLACPAATMDAYLLVRGQTRAGYFLLGRVGYQYRIADLWIRSADAQEWAEAYAAAAAIARADPHITEVTVAASSPLQIAAIQRAGYRRTHSEPVFVSDPGSMLGGRNDLAVSLLENDGFYWSGNGG